MRVTALHAVGRRFDSRWCH